MSPQQGFTMIPNSFFDVWLPKLTKAELRVLLYLARRTVGFQRESVEIGLRCIAHGLPGKDSGTALNTEAVTAAINTLAKYGLVRFTAGARGRRTYSVHFAVKPDCTDYPHSDCTDYPHSDCTDYPHSHCTDYPHSDCTDYPHTNKEREIKLEIKNTLLFDGDTPAASAAVKPADAIAIWFTEEFWPIYPRHDGKVGALKAARAKGKTEALRTEILAGLNAHLQELTSREKRFIPLPATWLNGERWRDEPMAPRSAGAAQRLSDKQAREDAEWAAILERMGPEE